MSNLKLDLQKLFDLQVLLIESDQDLLHLFRQMLSSLGIKKIETVRQIDELLQREEPLQADVVFLDYGVDEQLTGAEIASKLIQYGILPNRTRLVLMANQNDRAQYAIEFPYHIISYLPRPFNKFNLDLELKHHVMYGQVLKPLLTLAGLGRYQDCLKLLLHNLQQPMPNGLEPVLQRLRVQLLLDQHRYEAVVPLLKGPVAEQQGWALWALFRIRYERGDLAACHAFLADPSEEIARYAERRELWQIYLALQTEDYAKAYQVANTIPSVGMSQHLVRLVHMIMVLAGQNQRAEEFIERKRRLAGRGELWLQLGLSHARAQIWRLQHIELTDDERQNLLEAIQLLLDQLRLDKTASDYRESLLLLEVHLQLFTHGKTDAQRHAADLAQINWLQMSVSVLCHAAVVFHALELSERLLPLFVIADQKIQPMLDNCYRIFSGCLMQHAFNLTVPQAERCQFYQQMAAAQLQAGDTLASAKLLRRALSYEPGNDSLRQQIYTQMRQLGLTRFRGINLPAG